MSDSNNGDNGKDHELIRMKDVVRGSGHEVLRLDKIMEKAMQNPTPDFEVDFLEMKKVEVGMIIVESKRDLYTLLALKEKRLAEGDNKTAKKMESRAEALKKRIEQYEAIRKTLSHNVRGVLRNVIREARQPSHDLLTQIEKRQSVNDERMLVIAHEAGLSDEAIDSLALTENDAKPSLKERTVNALKGFVGMFVSPIPAEDEEDGSESGSENAGCPHCGKPANHADPFCGECGKPLSQDQENA